MRLLVSIKHMSPFVYIKQDRYDVWIYETGHIAIVIICGKITEHAAKTKATISLLCVFSILPDIDMFHPFGIKHGGPTHSIILITIFFLPFLLIYGKKVLPYFVATLSHPLIGDSPFWPLRILWPLSRQGFGFGEAVITNSKTHIFLECFSWLVALILLIKNDFTTLFKPLKSNLFSVIPLSSLLCTFLLAPKSMMLFSISISILHITVILLLTYSIIKSLKNLF